MDHKPKHAWGYTTDTVHRVRDTLLFVAAKLGDLMEDIVVVGGLVPYFLVDQSPLPEDRRHVGSMDLDLGLSLAILDEERYREISKRLRAEGLRPETKPDGSIRRQTWSFGEGTEKVTVDFLMQVNEQGVPSGKLTQIEHDFAAIIVDGLELAFMVRRRVRLSGSLPNGSTLAREVWVCGPGAFVVLKAMAFRHRGENKDAYDLFYLLREMGVEEVAAEFARFDRDHPTVQEAVRILREDFLMNNAGRVQAAEFIAGSPDEGIEGDVLVFITKLLAVLDAR